MEMVHPRAVFLTKRNLPRVLHLRQNPVRQFACFVVVQKTRTRFGMRFSSEILRFGGVEVFEMEIGIGVGFHRREVV